MAFKSARNNGGLKAFWFVDVDGEPTYQNSPPDLDGLVRRHHAVYYRDLCPVCHVCYEGRRWIKITRSESSAAPPTPTTQVMAGLSYQPDDIDEWTTALRCCEALSPETKPARSAPAQARSRRIHHADANI